MELAFKFNTREEVEVFLNLLEKHVDSYIVKTRFTHVYVQIDRDVELVKALAKIVKGKTRRRIPLLVVYRELERPLPPEVLTDALTFSGRDSKVVKDSIDTTASLDEVLAAAVELSRLYGEFEKIRLTPPAKRLAVVYAYVKKTPPEVAVEELTRVGILSGGRLGVRDAKRQLAKLLKE